MKAGWTIGKLGDVLRLEYGKPLPADERSQTGSVPVYGANGIIGWTDRIFRTDPTVIVGRKGSAGEIQLTDGAYWPLDVTYFVDFDRAEFDLKFLFYLLARVDLRTLAKGVKPGVNRNDAYEMPVAYPLLKEQRRIVAVLDEAFAAIATATANAEKNLANARDLFVGELNKIFTIESEGWELKRLSEVASDFGRGKSRHRPRGDPKLYGTAAPLIQTGDLSNADHWLCDYTQMYSKLGVSQSKLWPKGTVCVAIVGANVGESAILNFEACFPDSVIGIVPDQGISDSEYIEYLLQFFKSDLKKQGKGTARDNINIATFENQLMPFPDIHTQRKVVSRLNALSEAIQQLSGLLEAKLSALAQLKQSLLHRAFVGELTKSVLQKQSVAYTTPEFAAQVIAFAYYQHERKRNQKTFGHVKAQKALHLVESIGGIDLGRHPIKDAAGPNDFQHMLRVTEWAEREGFFKFVLRVSGQGYDFVKLANYESFLADALAALAPVRAALKRAIDPIVLMVSKDAGIFATVHAAWNNLLHDGVAISDDAIVKEARDNWHAAKLKIPKAKFRKAIQDIRASGLAPDGTAKYVGGQGALF